MCRNSSSAHASGSAAAAPLRRVSVPARATGSADAASLALHTRSPPERHPPTTDLPPASRVPTDPRCLSPIPRATNSVARAVDGSLYRLRDEICLRYSSASSSTNATALTHKTHEFLRSEEHTSELQSLAYLVCRLLLEKKNKDIK